VELNSRIDVLILGVFTNDAAVGAYSFAAFFVEGLMHVTVISRRLIDPILTRLAHNDIDHLIALLRRGRNLGVVVSGLVGIVAVAAYPCFATIAGTRELAMQSWSTFAILMIGACVYAVYATFGGIFLQTGNPAVQTRFNITILSINIMLNFALVPSYGLLGAAVATGLSFLLGAIYFRFLLRRHLSISI
jgi:O-antigen/teichoic acid export membrane protein